MPQRVRPIVLLGLIAALVLSIGIFASAKTGGGAPGDALAVGAAEVGKPYAYGTDGPGTFSCTGLVRHILRTIGVDNNAPWDHHAYLSAYPTHDKPVPGDVVVYPDGVGMYVGDNTVLMANDADQVVGYYPMDSIGTPLGFANPYGGTLDPAASDTAEVEPVMPAEETVVDPTLLDPAFDETAIDPTLLDPSFDETVVDPAMLDPAVADETVIDPVALDEPVIDPTFVEPAAVDPMML